MVMVVGGSAQNILYQTSIAMPVSSSGQRSSSSSEGQTMADHSASVHSDRSSSQLEDGRQRKRVRKGTKSCWECKRRKIRCQLSNEDVPVCAGCLSRGTTCISQEFPEDRESTSSNNLGDRLGRVENLLDKLIAKITAYEDMESAQKIHTPESMGNDVLSPFATDGSTVQEGPPILSLFDNTVIGRREASQSQMSTPASRSVGPRTPACRVPKLDRLRQALVEIAPSQEDVNMICEASSAWILVHVLSPCSARCFSLEKETGIPSVFDLSDASKMHPTSIAKTLLCISVCLQSLDSGFDTSSLHLYPSIETRVEKYLATVQALITSDDELVSTMEGLECLFLQGAYYIVTGSPRRAWLALRKALNVGQLMGIHKKTTPIPKGTQFWHQIVQVERYLTLLLGLPIGSPEDSYDADENFQNPNVDVHYLIGRKLCDITGLIINRNQLDQSNAYASTQKIDEMLENLAKEMPRSWWSIPDTTSDDASEPSSLKYNRIMMQICFYHLEALLHLPFMLRAANERRYEYSKFSCQKASREMMVRYLIMRKANSESICCKMVDFGALTTTVTLFLGLLDPAHADDSLHIRQQRESDRALIQRMVDLMEEVSQGGRDVVAKQIANVIKSLLNMESKSNSGERPGSLRLTIPYFGTMTIQRPDQSISDARRSSAQPISQLHPVLPEQSPMQAWPETQYHQNPLSAPTVSFTSTQFPRLVPEQQPLMDLGWQESDTLFFDSLLNTDIDGNWRY